MAVVIHCQTRARKGGAVVSDNMAEEEMTEGTLLQHDGYRLLKVDRGDGRGFGGVIEDWASLGLPVCLSILWR